MQHFRGTKETTLLGTGFILLNEYKPDIETRFLLNLEGDFQEGQLDLVLWITGVNEDNSTADITEDINVHDEEYKLYKSLKNISDVGYLTVHVVQAMGLGSTKLQGNLTQIICTSFIVFGMLPSCIL